MATSLGPALYKPAVIFWSADFMIATSVVGPSGPFSLTASLRLNTGPAASAVVTFTGLSGTSAQAAVIATARHAQQNVADLIKAVSPGLMAGDSRAQTVIADKIVQSRVAWQLRARAGIDRTFVLF